MKKFLLALVLAIFHLHAFAQGAPDLMTEAQRAYLRGDTQAAKEKFQTILARDPGNQTAQNYLRMIEALERSEGSGSQLAKQLESLILPKVELRDATFGSALEFLKQQADKLSQGKTKVNFVVSLPPDFVETKRVSLNLSNVPFTEAMRYLGDLVEVKFSVEKYAVLVKPKAASPQ
jgi:hypothetical protein